MLLVHGLAGHPQRLGDQLPRPATSAGVVYVKLLELLDQIAQRSHRGQADGGVSAVDRVIEPGQLAHTVSLG